MTKLKPVSVVEVIDAGSGEATPEIKAGVETFWTDNPPAPEVKAPAPKIVSEVPPAPYIYVTRIKQLDELSRGFWQAPGPSLDSATTPNATVSFEMIGEPDMPPRSVPRSRRSKVVHH